jgi:type III secretion system YscJ/HrcJ family lipoprotein
MLKILRPTFILCLIVLLIACSGDVVLLQNLDQKNTNDILVMLAKSGITAKKKIVEKQQEVSFSILVDAADEQHARELLVSNHLPREKELGLSGICKDAGMIPTPKTEKCREMLATKGEIINSLQTIPSVVSADIVLNVPDKEDFPDPNLPQKRPTASVVLQIANDASPDVVTEAKVQQFVANAVTGMDLRDVTVIISRVTNAIPSAAAVDDMNPQSTSVAGAVSAETMAPENMVSIGGMMMDAASAQRFKIFAVCFLIFFVILSGILIGVLLKLAQMRQRKGSSSGSDKPALPEKTRMDQLVAETENQDMPQGG